MTKLPSRSLALRLDRSLCSLLLHDNSEPVAQLPHFSSDSFVNILTDWQQISRGGLGRLQINVSSILCYRRTRPTPEGSMSLPRTRQLYR